MNILTFLKYKNYGHNNTNFGEVYKMKYMKSESFPFILLPTILSFDRAIVCSLFFHIFFFLLLQIICEIKSK